MKLRNQMFLLKNYLNIKMIKIIKYSAKYKIHWNNFLYNSNIDHFFFNRDFIEYHKKKFIDNSLIFIKNKKIIALFPASINGNILYSHSGLTYGGIITNIKFGLFDFQDLLKALNEYSKKIKLKKIIIKQIPFIHKHNQNNLDEYTLFLNNGKIIYREPNSVIFLNELNFPWSTLKSKFQKSKQNNVIFSNNIHNDLLIDYYDLLSYNLLDRYKTKPTHSLSDLRYLSSKFPENIKLFTAKQKNQILGGILLFINSTSIHTQYFASNEVGRKLNVLDCLIYKIIKKYKNNKKYISLGISSEKNGKQINNGLLTYKSKLRSRLILNDTYEIKLL
jgi:hypothetical protein